MNIAWTRAADGLARRAFSVDDIQRMMEAGILSEDERFELIEVSAKRVAHDRIKHFLNMALVRAAPEGAFVAIEATLQPGPDILVEPDIRVIFKSVYNVPPKTFAQPRPEDVLLLVEVAASSLAYDRRTKARLYARHGIREFWVIDANEGITWIHTGPTDESWTSIVECGPQESLTTSALPGFSVRLSDSA